MGASNKACKRGERMKTTTLETGTYQCFMEKTAIRAPKFNLYYLDTSSCTLFWASRARRIYGTLLHFIWSLHVLLFFPSLVDSCGGRDSGTKE